LKASKLITELQAAIAEHGDLDVTCEDGHLGVADVNSVSHYGPMADGNTFFVLLFD